MRTYIITGESDLLPAIITITKPGAGGTVSGILRGLHQVFDHELRMVIEEKTFEFDDDHPCGIPTAHLSFPLDAELVSEEGGSHVISIEECQPIVIGEPTYKWDEDVRLTMSEIVAAERLEGFLRSTEVGIKDMVSGLGLTDQEWEKIKATKEQFFPEDFVEVVDSIMEEE